jgi:hypothetical protein
MFEEPAFPSKNQAGDTAFYVPSTARIDFLWKNVVEVWPLSTENLDTHLDRTFATTVRDPTQNRHFRFCTKPTSCSLFNVPPQPAPRTR